MTQFAKFDSQGRILFTGDVPEAMLELQGDMIYEGAADPATQYIVKRQLRDRPPSPARRVGAELVDLPVPCDILINGVRYPCGDATATLSFDYPGRYVIKVVAFPYLDAQFELST